jgi:hypothetical protein
MKLYDETDCLPHTRPPAAFPHPEPRDPQISITAPGLTKREYAAIHSAAGMAGLRVTRGNDLLAKEAVALADAVLREAGE